MEHTLIERMASRPSECEPPPKLCSMPTARNLRCSHILHLHTMTHHHATFCSKLGRPCDTPNALGRLRAPVVAGVAHGVPDPVGEVLFVQQPGVSPTRNAAGSASSLMLVDGSASNRTTLLAKRLPVHVLPHALGPSTATAGDDLSASAICWSTTRGLYPAGTSLPISIPQIMSG